MNFERKITLVDHPGLMEQLHMGPSYHLLYNIKINVFKTPFKVKLKFLAHPTPISPGVCKILKNLYNKPIFVSCKKRKQLSDN